LIPELVIPDFVTHYHLSSRPPFLNLSDLPPHQLGEILGALDRERTDGLSARIFGPRYMDFRRRTEELLRTLFLEAGGRPERVAPHYFVLGSSSWYEGLAPEMAALVIRLADLPTELTSLTFPDSLTSMGFGPDYGLPQEDRPYHGRVYRLEDLPALVSAYGLPSDGSSEETYDGYHRRPFEKYIEVQLWSDRPLAAYGTESSGW
jgi:hypothetical protein